jgi:hypothetical protein
MKLKRALATGAVVVMAGFSLAACGDDDNGDGGGGGSSDSGDAGDSPDNADTDDFCAIFTEMTSDLDGAGSADEQADAAHELADKLADVGTPEGADESQRNGFELYVDFLADVESDDIEKFEDADPNDEDAFANTLGMDEDEVADVTAFFTFAATACVPGMEDLPSGVPTE